MKARNPILVTGGDETYAALICELVESIRDLPEGRHVPVGVLDGGLSRDTVVHLKDTYGCLIVRPDWPVRLPGWRIRGREFLRVELAKAHLDEYFPAYQEIVWIDADAWVQSWEAVEWLVEAAARGRMGIVSQTGRASDLLVRVKWVLGFPVAHGILYKNARRAGLPRSVQRRLAGRATLNAGVYALRRDAPHWEKWRDHQRRVLRGRARIFTASQLAIGLMAYVDELPFELLPETCNYGGPWRMDAVQGRLVEYYLPHRPCGIVHLIAQDEMRRDPSVTTTVLDLEDRPHALSLRYSYWKRFRRCAAHHGG